jgi:ABC-type uncharacterized transport system substrate-binding protein
MKRIRVVWMLPTVFVAAVMLGCMGREVPQKVAAEQPAAASAVSLNKDVTGKKVLLVHSYHPEYPWVASITAGVVKGLQSSGVELEIFYMDTKRKTDEPWKIRAGELAARKLEEYHPDVVITVDDNAQQYFAVNYVDKSLPFVFCGVNADASKYGYPASNITGIIERPHFNGTIKFANQLQPMKRIAILSCDDETSQGALAFMKEEFLDYEITEFKLVKTFAEWQQTVHAYNTTVDAFGVYMYHTLKDGRAPESLDPTAVMAWTIANATVPTLGFFDFGIRDGLLVGEVESGAEHGEKAARYVLEILRGVPLSSLPIIKANIGTKMVNHRTAALLGITIPEKVSELALTVPE